MSQIQQLPQFDKLWKILDHAVKEGKYKHIPNRLTDGGHGRCINGLLFTYLKPEIEINPDKRKLPEIRLAYREIARKYNIGWEEEYKVYTNESIDELLTILKDEYAKTGKVSEGCFTMLNNKGYDFVKLRDLFKEMDV